MPLPIITGEFFVPNPSRQGNLRFTPSGSAVAKVRGKAANRVKDENSGEWSDKDEIWLSIEFWGPDAERLVELPDNSSINVTGSFTESKYQVSGEDRTEMLIKGKSFGIIERKGAQQNQGQQQQQQYQQQAPQQGGYPAPQQGGYPAPQQGGYPAPQQGGYPAPVPAQQPGGYPAPQQQPQQQPGGYPAPAQGQPGGYPQQ